MFMNKSKKYIFFAIAFMSAQISGMEIDLGGVEDGMLFQQEKKQVSVDKTEYFNFLNTVQLIPFNQNLNQEDGDALMFNILSGFITLKNIENEKFFSEYKLEFEKLKNYIEILSQEIMHKQIPCPYSKKSIKNLLEECCEKTADCILSTFSKEQQRKIMNKKLEKEEREKQMKKFYYSKESAKLFKKILYNNTLCMEQLQKAFELKPHFRKEIIYETIEFIFPQKKIEERNKILLNLKFNILK